MPSIEDCRVVAEIRLGTSIASLREMLAHASLKSEVENYWALCPGIDRKSVDIILIKEGFAQEIAIHGVHIGMDGYMLSQHPLGRKLLCKQNVPRIYSSYLGNSDEAWEMIVDKNAKGIVTQIIYQRFGLLEQQNPAGYAEMMELAERQAREKAEAIASAPARIAEHKRLIGVRGRLSELSDPDDLLDYWSRNDQVWGDGGPDLMKYADWLRAGGPERWHAVATSWNWDNSSVPFRWIASRPNCDAATALEIFYAGQPLDTVPDSSDGLLLSSHPATVVRGRIC